MWSLRCEPTPVSALQGARHATCFALAVPARWLRVFNPRGRKPCGSHLTHAPAGTTTRTCRQATPGTSACTPRCWWQPWPGACSPPSWWPLCTLAWEEGRGGVWVGVCAWTSSGGWRAAIATLPCLSRLLWGAVAVPTLPTGCCSWLLGCTEHGPACPVLVAAGCGPSTPPFPLTARTKGTLAWVAARGGLGGTTPPGSPCPCSCMRGLRS